jgi:hypothetical protein
LHPRMIMPVIILGQRERREEEEQASETFHVPLGINRPSNLRINFSESLVLNDQ